MFLATTSLTSAMVTAFENVANDLTEMLSQVTPVALTVVAGVMVVTFGVRIFKSIISK